jgi:hypothetical protein
VWCEGGEFSVQKHAELGERDRKGRRSLQEACCAAGFRRVELVTLIVRGTDVTARATGVLHRYPRTVPISLTTAGELVAAGAPLSLERR